MPSNAILHEAQQLHNVSDRLDLLAEEHPIVSDALAAISGNVRNTATLLQVLANDFWVNWQVSRRASQVCADG